MNMRSNLEQVLAAGHFAVTAELGPPKTAALAFIKKRCGMLASCADAVNLTDNRPIVFTDEERRALDALVGINVSSATQIIDRVRRANSLKISDGKTRTTIELRPDLLDRLKSRCFGLPFPKFLKQIVVEELERYAGMR